MEYYHTSLRSRNAADTLRIAKEYAQRYGISRVTNTIKLDTIGIPVFSSIRPTADLSSLCVCAGKGLLPIEAEIGAYMEAIEFAMAEERHSKAKASWHKVIDVLDGHSREEAILDFCPQMGVEIDLMDEMECVPAFDLLHQKSYLAPAELAFMPYYSKGKEKSYFGCHTNGLASGNNRMEASIHGILEVIERDILAFQVVQATASRVTPESFPEKIKGIHQSILKAGMELLVDYVDNEWELPFFSAILLDWNSLDPLYINGGYGCHFDKDIAIMRAVTEAIQSRMTFIHGGRDDLMEDYKRFEHLSDIEKGNYFRASASRFQRFDKSIAFDAITGKTWRFDRIEVYLEVLLEHLKAKGIEYVLQVSHTAPDEPLQVVKIIIPKLEFFTAVNVRVGKRLRDYAQPIAHNTFRGAQSH